MSTTRRSGGRGTVPLSRRGSRRQKVLDGAAVLLARRGFGGLHIDDVADAVGMAKPQIYRLFDSKNDIYLATLDRERRRLERTFDGAIGDKNAAVAGSDVAEAATRVLQVLFDHHRRHPHTLPLLFGATDWYHEAALHRRALRRLCHRIRQALRVWSNTRLAPRSSAHLAQTLATVAVSNLSLVDSGAMTATEAWEISVAMAHVASASCAHPVEAKCSA